MNTITRGFGRAAWTRGVRFGWLMGALLLPVTPSVAADPPGPPLPLRSAPSPAGVTDFTKPQFDTTTPVFDSTDAKPKGPGTVVAEVDGRAITLGDVGIQIKELPPSVSHLPFETLYPLVLDRLIKQQALLIRAQKDGVDDQPAVRRQIKAASDHALENAALQHYTRTRITETMLLERYQRVVAGRPGPEEVRVSLILAPTEAEARAIIAELKAGADFATLARRSSKHESSRDGGDLGFNGASSMAADVAATVFALEPGKVSGSPLESDQGWLVLRAGERRRAPAPTFAQAREELVLALAREGVNAVTAESMADVTVRMYHINGIELEAEARPDSQ
jgi:peptidyl-prolyl cis-trans isomerase C